MNLRETDAGASLGIFPSREESLELADVKTWSCRVRPAQGETDPRDNLALMTLSGLPKLSFSKLSSTYGCFSYMI